tara:strand:+ start:28 stop:261 length:234 start_codon:yes stop_codon:yes gene_type:complete
MVPKQKIANPLEIIIMSKEIQNMYKKMDAHLSNNVAPKHAPSNSLVSKREDKGEDEMYIVGYVKKIRELRGELNASK